MPEDVRRSAEIRRMASQKVAAELIKASTFAVSEDLDKGFSNFLDIVDLIDKDVVEAGDRAETHALAERSQQRAGNPPHPLSGATPGPTPQKPPEAASGSANGLSAAARSKLVQLLEEIDNGKVKLKLGSMGLPVFPEDAAKDMNMDQAREIAKWSRELSNA